MRDDATLHSIERAMIRIARSMGRRDLGRQLERSLGSRVDAAFLQAIAAVDELSGPNEAPTIKDIARYLDVHHSRASRLVKDMIRAGLVMRLASQEDARKSPLALSEKGREIATAIHAARARFFSVRLQALSRAERRALAGLLERFAANDAVTQGKSGRGPQAESNAAPRRAPSRLRARKRR